MAGGNKVDAGGNINKAITNQINIQYRKLGLGEVAEPRPSKRAFPQARLLHASTTKVGRGAPVFSYVKTPLAG